MYTNLIEVESVFVNKTLFYSEFGRNVVKILKKRAVDFFLLFTENVLMFFFHCFRGNRRRSRYHYDYVINNPDVHRISSIFLPTSSRPSRRLALFSRAFRFSKNKILHTPLFVKRRSANLDTHTSEISRVCERTVFLFIFFLLVTEQTTR